MKNTLAALAAQLDQGKTSSRALTEQCLARIADRNGEGARTFTRVDADDALAQADRCDTARTRGVLSTAATPFAGIPISIKDLFDVAGEITTAGSRVLANAAPAEQDAPVVRRLREAGFVLIGRTNMSEFAFSGLGLNPHFGTPKNPWDRGSSPAAGRISGGSSSGAAISVTDGMAFGALGTDTGGSCRIPAALTGIVGFKPTAARVPLDGAFPLSGSLDSIGALANSVACCASMFSVMGAAPSITDAVENRPFDLKRARFLLPTRYLVDDMDDAVANAFSNALTRLSQAGATLVEQDLPPLRDIPGYNSKGGFPAAEGYYYHHELLAASADDYDSRVKTRLLRGQGHSAVDYLTLLDNRRRYIAAMTSLIAPFDAVLFPTVPTVAPPIAPLESDDALFTATNLLMLRNSTAINWLDGCAVSVPIHAPQTAPVGMTIAGLHRTDEAVFSIAASVESATAYR